MLLLLVSFAWETPRMSINLIESEHRSQKSLGGTFVSIALHASVITLAVYASANAGVISVRVPSDTTIVFYPQHPQDPTPTPSAPAHPLDPATPRLPRRPVIGFQPVIGDPPLPPIDPSPSTASVDSLFRDGEPGSDVHGATTTTGADSGEPLFASQVEKPATARGGNPVPKYPSLLESSRVEGTLLVQFIVDTLGTADMTSFKVLESTNDLFAESLRATLPRWRFYPAEAGGRKVRQVVQLPLKFVAPRR
jgi:protein TonB